MIRRPAPAWIDLARDDAPSAYKPRPEEVEAPAIDAPHRGENDNVGMMPELGLTAGGRSALLPGKPARGRRLGVTAALILSTAIHAAAFVFIADRLSVEGMQAATDGVSVEIVFDVPAASAASAVAGKDGADKADAEPIDAIEQTLAEVVEPVEAVEPEAVAAERPEAIEAEPMLTAAAESTETVEAPVAETIAPDEAIAAVEPVAAPSVEFDRADAVDGDTAPETVEAVPDGVETVVEAAAPAFAPPAPNAATMALLAAPPPVETMAAPAAEPVDPVRVLLPETTDAVPEQRPLPPEPMAKVAASATVTETAAKPAQAPRARAAEPTRRTVETSEPRAKQAPAKDEAPARSGERPAGSSRKPAAPASAGSQARSAAAPGAEAKYGRALLSHVERHKRYPAAARSAGITGSTRLAITIDRTGGLAGARVAAGSGHQILDQEALAVARRAAPYPRPPEGVGGNTFSFAVTLRFAR